MIPKFEYTKKRSHAWFPSVAGAEAVVRFCNLYWQKHDADFVAEIDVNHIGRQACIKVTNGEYVTWIKHPWVV